MKRLAFVLSLAAGCAPRVVIEDYVPFDRGKPTAVVHPVGQVWAMDADVLQRAIADRLRAAGFRQVVALPQGASGAGQAQYYVTVRSEAMARPLDDTDDTYGTPRRYHGGERVKAELRIRDVRGALLYHAVWVESLTSSLTEARVAETLVQPLD